MRTSKACKREVKGEAAVHLRVDPAVVLEPNISMGATQTWQQLSFIQGEICRVFGTQQQQVPATPGAHTGGREGGEGGDEYEEEQRSRTSRENCQPAPGVHNEGVPAGSVVDQSKDQQGRSSRSSSSLKEMICRSVKADWKNKKKRNR